MRQLVFGFPLEIHLRLHDHILQAFGMARETELHPDLDGCSRSGMNGARLNEHDGALVARHRAMHRVARHDIHFAGRKRHGLTAKFEDQFAVQHEDDPVRGELPDLLAVQFDQLELTTGRFRDNARRPAISELGEFVPEIYRIRHAMEFFERMSDPSHAISLQTSTSVRDFVITERMV
jgi:hypothetical protein